MPKKIELKEIETQLPAFVRMIAETYKGARYKARFVDIDYNEEFEAIPRSVILLQHGCKTRANQRRKDATGYTGANHVTPLAEIQAALPSYLEIDEASYTGKRNKATFRDKEYNVTFEMVVANVLRTGKGYCPQRRKVEFEKSINISIEEIEKRLQKLYGNKLKIIHSSYINTNSLATFEDETGKQIKIMVQQVLTGRFFDRDKQTDWKKKVLARDGNKCLVCDSKNNLIAHHIFSWADNQEKRFDVNNGATLCADHHKEFHSQFANGGNTLKQFTEYLNEKGERLSTSAREIEARIMTCDN